MSSSTIGRIVTIFNTPARPDERATCVIYNPAAGRGRAEKLLGELRATLGDEIELRPSRKPWHAVELARQAAEEGFAKVVAAGGDGTVHEVANGVLQSGRRDVVFSVWPIGSANDYAYSLGYRSSGGRSDSSGRRPSSWMSMWDGHSRGPRAILRL